MSEQTGQGPGQGRDAAGAGEGSETGAADPQEQVRTEGDRMARKLVQDVAAYEVDPPPPARVQEEPPSGA